MEMSDAQKIRTGNVMTHARFGRVIARGTVYSSGTWGDRVWVDTPESAIAPDHPYNAHISNLEFAD